MEIAIPVGDVIDRLERRRLADFADAVEDWTCGCGTARE
jgi:hypothetical protein